MPTSTLRAISVVLLLLFAATYFYTDRQEQHHQKTALPAAKSLLSTISVWEKQTLLEHLAGEAKNSLSDQQLEKLMSHYRQFGRFISADNLNFSKLASALSLFGPHRVNYSGTAAFENGAAHVNITLTENDNSFLIYNISITKI